MPTTSALLMPATVTSSGNCIAGASAGMVSVKVSVFASSKLEKGKVQAQVAQLRAQSGVMLMLATRYGSGVSLHPARAMHACTGSWLFQWASTSLRALGPMYIWETVRWETVW